MEKPDKRVERSHGKIRTDKAFEKLQSKGFTGSGRAVRRAVTRVKLN